MFFLFGSWFLHLFWPASMMGLAQSGNSCFADRAYRSCMQFQATYGTIFHDIGFAKQKSNEWVWALPIGSPSSSQRQHGGNVFFLLTYASKSTATKCCLLSLLVAVAILREVPTLTAATLGAASSTDCGPKPVMANGFHPGASLEHYDPNLARAIRFSHVNRLSVVPPMVAVSSRNASRHMHNSSSSSGVKCLKHVDSSTPSCSRLSSTRRIYSAAVSPFP